MAVTTAGGKGAAAAAASESDKFRRRLLDGLAASIEEDGYPKTTIADIVRRARTSRRTFYEHFSSKEECFVALLTEVNNETIQNIYAGVDRAAPWKEQARQAIEAWISSAEARAPITLSWIRDVPALGASARRLQRDSMEAFIEMVQTLGEGEELRSAGVGPVSRQRAIMLLGGLRELVAITVESGGAASDITEEAVDATIALLGPR